MNKKLLVLLPIAMLALAGCTPAGEDPQGGGGTDPEGGYTPTGEKMVFDMSGRTEHGDPNATEIAQKNAPYLNKCEEGSTIGYMAACMTEGNVDYLVDAYSTNVTSGNGEGGAFSFGSGFLKFGTGSKNGVLRLNFETVQAVKVTVYAQDWNGTSYNKISVNNGDAQFPDHSKEGFHALDFTIDATAEVEITSLNTDEARGGRVFVQKIVVEF